MMYSILVNKLLPALCWTLVHSFWQGLVLTVLAGGVMVLTRRSSAALRYHLLCFLFFVFLGGVAASFLLEWSSVNAPQSVGLQLYPHDELLPDGLLSKWIEKTTAFLDVNAQTIVFIWLIVLVYKSGRLVLDVYQLRRIRRHKIMATESRWARRIQALAGEIGIRRKVSLLESALLRVPIVVGYFKPLILMPVGMLTHLPPEELEAILLHELAHIRRHDYLVNFIQCLTETAFFFNPGLLWVSSLLRVERESCCDDIAITHTRDKLGFVEALIRCKEISQLAPSHALGLFGNKQLLVQRANRIVFSRNKTLSPFEAAFFMSSLFTVILLFSNMRKEDNSSLHHNTTIYSMHSDISMTSVSALNEPQLAAQQGGTKYLETPPPEKNSRVTSAKPAAPWKQKRRTPNVVGVTKPIDQARVVNNDLPILKESETDDNGNSDQLVGEYAIAVEGFVAIDRQIIEHDREQTRIDREKAERDHEQAAKDREQAERDRQQAERDREQAGKDREQTERERNRLIDQQITLAVRAHRI